MVSFFIVKKSCLKTGNDFLAASRVFSRYPAGVLLFFFVCFSGSKISLGSLFLGFQITEYLLLAKAFHLPNLAGSFTILDYAPETLIVNIPVGVENRFVVDDLYILEVGDKVAANPGAVAFDLKSGKLHKGR